MDSYNNDDSYTSNKMTSSVGRDTYESNDLPARSSTYERGSHPASSLGRESGRMDAMSSGMIPRKREPSDDFESAASREGRTTMATEESYGSGRMSHDSDDSRLSENSQRSESSYGQQRVNDGFGRSTRNNEFSSSNNMTNTGIGASSGEMGMDVGHKTRKDESIIDKAIDGAAEYAKKKW